MSGTSASAHARIEATRRVSFQVLTKDSSTVSGCTFYSISLPYRVGRDGILGPPHDAIEGRIQHPTRFGRLLLGTIEDAGYHVHLHGQNPYVIRLGIDNGKMTECLPGMSFRFMDLPLVVCEIIESAIIQVRWFPVRLLLEYIRRL